MLRLSGRQRRGELTIADRYGDADPEEFVNVVAIGPMTLRTAVRTWIEAS